MNQTATASRKCGNPAWGNFWGLHSALTPICQPCFNSLHERAAALGIHLPAGPLTRQQQGQQCQQIINDDDDTREYRR